jgi:FkbM family methyltransferase
MIAVKAVAPENTLAKPAKIFFPNLDGLRFLAFCFVFVEHGLGPMAGLIRSTSPAASLVKENVIQAGWVGVSFFFVLSGFLITYLILIEIDLRGRLDVGSFYMRRTLRIWPLYFAVIAFAIILYPAAKSLFGLPGSIQIGNPFYYAAFLGNFDVINQGAGHGAFSTNITWSVAIEEQFYCLWPLLFFLLPRRSYALIFPSIILLSTAFRWVHTDDERIIYYHSLSVVSDLAIGGLAAYWSINSARFMQFIRSLGRPSIVTAYCIGAVLLIFKRPLFQAAGPAVCRLILASFFAFVVLEQNFADRSFIKASRLRLASFLGKYTYGLYLLHAIAITLLLGAFKFRHVEVDSAPRALFFAAASLGLSILLSILSYHLYEKRFLNLKQRFAPIGLNSLYRDKMGQPMFASAKTVLKHARDNPLINHIATSAVRATLRISGLRSDWAIKYLRRVGRVSAVLPNRSVLTLRSSVDDLIANHVYWEGWDAGEPESIRLWWALACQARTALDIGANVGHYALLAAHAMPEGEVYAFEPQAAAFDRLGENVALNHLSNLHCVRAACGRRSGRAQLYVSDACGIPSESSLRAEWTEAFAQGGEVQATEVDVVTIDAFCAERRTGPIDLVKLDTEGTESEVLEGMTGILANDRPHLLCEVLSGSGTEATLEDILQPLGYRFYFLSDTGPVLRDRIEGQPDGRWELRNYLFSHLSLDEILTTYRRYFNVR